MAFVLCLTVFVEEGKAQTITQNCQVKNIWPPLSQSLGTITHTATPSVPTLVKQTMVVMTFECVANLSSQSYGTWGQDLNDFMGTKISNWPGGVPTWNGRYVYRNVGIPGYGIALGYGGSIGSSANLNVASGSHQPLPSIPNWSTQKNPPVTSVTTSYPVYVQVYLIRLPQDVPISMTGMRTFSTVNIGYNVAVAYATFGGPNNWKYASKTNYINLSHRFNFENPPATCAGTPTVSGGNMQTLPNIYTNELGNVVGKTAGEKKFTLTFSGCQFLQKILVRNMSNRYPGTHWGAGALATTGTGSDRVAIQAIHKINGGWDAFGWPTTGDGALPYTYNIGGSSPSLEFGVRYYRVSQGSISSGTRNATLKIKFEFQ